eukprot:TRINITY_DN4315_c0_g1_i2.p1 TRINITY_DN4315_c0_g1~~TRINITY_DN4315_c0_g1_i2.p1  ORF type:complete len:354 (+),score=87.04 TRINITY_DN4315_c0_g1_i2:1615-2676(+)
MSTTTKSSEGAVLKVGSIPATTATTEEKGRPKRVRKERKIFDPEEYDVKPKEKKEKREVKRRKGKEKVEKKKPKEVLEDLFGQSPNDFTLYLPDEILLFVLSSLDYKTLLVAGQVCKRWNRMANGNDLWGEFCKKKGWTFSKGKDYKSLYRNRISSRSYCCNCGAKSQSRLKVLDITLCRTCQSTCEEYAVLNKSEAQDQFFLNDSDLTNVKSCVVGMGWGRKKFQFLKKDLEAYAFKKHGGVEGLNNLKAQREERKKVRLARLLEQHENQKRVAKTLLWDYYQTGHLWATLHATVREMNGLPAGELKTTSTFEMNTTNMPASNPSNTSLSLPLVLHPTCDPFNVWMSPLVPE